jgi:signal transduction histidine kinase
LPVRARPLAIRRILGNLIDNGLRHGTRALVSLTVEDSNVSLVVADDGPGVVPDHLTRLGEPFHRADPSRNRESGGAGLGLAIVRALASRDSAEVSFSNGPKGGLLVTVRYSLLPASGR